MEEFYPDETIDETADNESLFQQYVIGEDHELNHIDRLLNRAFSPADTESDDGR